MNTPSPIEVTEIGAALEMLVREKGINARITYGQLAEEFSYPPLCENWNSHPFSRIFPLLDEEDHLKSRPFRTALVVADSVKHPYPGDGFFKMLKSNRFRNNSKGFELRKIEYYVQELEALVDYYSISPMTVGRLIATNTSGRLNS